MPKPGDNVDCNWKGVPVKCGPRGLPHGTHSLYHNNGDGTFTDVTKAVGHRRIHGQLRHDRGRRRLRQRRLAGYLRRLRFHAELLFKNNHDGTFREEGVIRGVALSEDGQEQAGMGVGIGDYNLDGHLDIFKTHLPKIPAFSIATMAKAISRM